MSEFVRKKEAYEAIIETLEEIQKDLDSGAIVVVEGLKDVRALKTYGIRGDIRKCANTPLAVFCETATRKNKKIILLTDWDEAGRIRAGKMAEYLESLGADFDLMFRKNIIRFSKKNISDIESLCTYLTRLKNDLIQNNML